MDETRARELLQRERERIERLSARLSSEDELQEEQREPGEGSEMTFERELETGLAEDYAAQLAAVERAERRLAEGTYGLSVESGTAIPDARLEALPAAERTVEEQQALER